MAELSPPAERAMRQLGNIEVYLKVFDTLSLGKKTSEDGAERAQLLNLSALGGVLEEAAASREAASAAVPCLSVFPSLPVTLGPWCCKVLAPCPYSGCP